MRWLKRLMTALLVIASFTFVAVALGPCLRGMLGEVLLSASAWKTFLVAAAFSGAFLSLGAWLVGRRHPRL